MWKIIKWFIAFSVLGTVGWIAFKWYTSGSSVSIDALSLVPADAIYCITTDDPINTWKEISGSGTWTHLQRNAYFASLTSSANTLDSVIRDNDLLFDLIGSRSLIVSAHMTGVKQYDFLFLVDLQQVSGIKFMNDYISDFATDDISIQKEKYKEEDLITFHNPSDRTNLYVAFPGSYLVASYNRKILTASMEAYKTDSLQTKNAFLTSLNESTSPGLMKLYINYKLLPKFVSCYSNTANEYTARLGQALHATALNVTLDGDLIKATGHTFINDTIESYIKTLAISGKGPSEFAEVAPQRTAFALGLGFRSFAEFFANFEKNIQADVADYKEYRESLQMIENYLDISLQENFVNWIGDEIALLELQSSGRGIDNETALIFKADNIEKARKDLAFIEKMVRKKTPVKFKAVDHRGYSISYVSMKGLFKMLLGKFFARYDKPYYTIINNFVIFSNHPQTLKSIIDDYLDKTTLSRSEPYRDFRRQFEDESAVFVYINTPVLFQSLKKMADNPTQVSMEENKEYITSFRQLGFQLVPEETGFNTIIIEEHVAPEPPEEVVEVVLEESDSVAAEVPEEPELPEEKATVAEADPMTLPYIYAQNLSKPSFKSYFADSTVHFEVELKNGFKNGSFTEYFENGEVKMKGHFKNDKRDGAWRLYDESGKIILRRNYEDGEIKREKAKD
jgi:hypothetical protein